MLFGFMNENPRQNKPWSNRAEPRKNKPRHSREEYKARDEEIYLAMEQGRSPKSLAIKFGISIADVRRRHLNHSYLLYQRKLADDFNALVKSGNTKAILDTSIEDLPVPARLKGVLKSSAGLNTVRDLVKLNEATLFSYPSFGKKSYSLLVSLLAQSKLDPIFQSPASHSEKENYLAMLEASPFGELGNFFKLSRVLTEADVVSVDDGPLLSHWKVLDHNHSDGASEVIQFDWTDGACDHTETLTVDGIATGVWVDCKFVCENSLGEKTVIRFFKLQPFA